MYKLIEYGDNYLKAPGSLWQYYRAEQDINSGLFKFKLRLQIIQLL